MDHLLGWGCGAYSAEPPPAGPGVRGSRGAVGALGPGARPRADRADLLGPALGQGRDRHARGVEIRRLHPPAALLERAEAGRLDDLLELGGAVAVGPRGDRLDRRDGDRLPPGPEVDLENGGALRRVGKVEEEHLVEPPRPEELRRERLDAVGRRHDEHGRRRPVAPEPALLQPGEQAPDDPAADARIQVSGAGARQRLLDLVDVQDARRHGLGQPQGALGPGLGLADEAPEDAGHLEPEEREAPAPGDRAGEQALAGARDAQQEDPLRKVPRGEPPREGVGRAAEQRALGRDPGLQGREAADGLERLGRVEEVEESRRPDQRRLLVPHGRRHRRHPGPIPHERQGEGVLGLVPGEAAGGLEHRVAHGRRQRDLGGHHQLVEQALERLPRGQRVVQPGDVLLPLDGQRGLRRAQEERPLRGLRGGKGVPHAADQLRELGEIRVKVEEDGHGLLGQGHERLHRPQGIALALVQDLAVRVDPAPRHGPRDDAPAGGAEGPEVAQQALLLVGGDGEGGIARPEVVAQPFGEGTEHEVLHGQPRKRVPMRRARGGVKPAQASVGGAG